jgi:hypothetical protein
VSDTPGLAEVEAGAGEALLELLSGFIVELRGCR